LGTVNAQMFIGKDGKILKPVITKHLSPDIDSAVLKTLRASPPWIPGSKNGVAVRTLVKKNFNFGQLMELKIADPGANTVARRDADVTIDEPVGTADIPKQPFDPNKIYTSVEKVPEFPGGIQALMNYLKDNNSLKGTDKNINGRVILSFVVEINGTLTDIKVARGISTECDAEALRMLKLSPKWHPGIANGKSVRVAYMIPVQFGGS